MMNKNERLEKLNQAGINTSKYFTVDLDNGPKIHLIIDENGQPVVINKKEDEIAKQIIADGYVRNTKLHRGSFCFYEIRHCQYQSVNV